MFPCSGFQKDFVQLFQTGSQQSAVCVSIYTRRTKIKHSKCECILTPREQLNTIWLLFLDLHQVGDEQTARWLRTLEGNRPFYLQKNAGNPICTGAVLSCAVLVNWANLLFLTLLWLQLFTGAKTQSAACGQHGRYDIWGECRPGFSELIAVAVAVSCGVLLQLCFNCSAMTRWKEPIKQVLGSSLELCLTSDVIHNINTIGIPRNSRSTKTTKMVQLQINNIKQHKNIVLGKIERY